MTALLRFTIDHFLLLPIGGLLALIWANTAAESYFTVAHRLSFGVNEVGMALFFALVTQDVVEEIVPGGALHSWRRWTLPILAGLGGVIGAGLVYTALVVGWYQQEVLTPGWPVAGAVDLAFAYFVARAIFGRRHPAIPFVLLVGVAADLAAMLFVASREAFVDVRAGGTALMFGALAIAFALRQWHVRSFWPYLLVSGPLSWWALTLDGLHPAFALVPIVPFFAHAPRTLDVFGDPPHGRHDSPTHYEHVMRYPIQAILFLFGLVNAGALLNGYGDGTWALLAGATIGKPAGMCAAVAVAVAAGLHLPARFHWRDLVIVAFATTGVFAFGLFFATAVFPMGPVLAELKLGSVATGIGVPLAFAAAWLLRAGRFHPHSPHTSPSHAPHHAHRHRVKAAHAGTAVAHPTRVVSLLLAAAFVTSPAAAGAQHPTRKDDGIAQRVAEELYEHNVLTVMIFVDRGVVTLEGTVPTLWARQKALDQVSRVEDVVSVVNQIIIPKGESDEQLAFAVASKLQRYVFFTIFDDANVQVIDGVVTLTGRVTMPHKAEAFADLAAHVAGVQEVRNQIRTLPVSPTDDAIRYAIARQIYGDDLFARHATRSNPPIHIVVENGAVTLTGFVNSEVERRKAEVIARGTFPVRSVTNQLRLDGER